MVALCNTFFNVNTVIENVVRRNKIAKLHDWVGFGGHFYNLE